MIVAFRCFSTRSILNEIGFEPAGEGELYADSPEPFNFVDEHIQAKSIDGSQTLSVDGHLAVAAAALV